MRSQSQAAKERPSVFRRSAKRAGSPSAGIRPAVFYGCFATLFATNILTALGFLMAPDIAALMSGQNEQVLSAYEDRIAQLRIEVDRLHSRQYAQAGDLNLQLQELTQQQEVLLEQHQYVKQLAQKAAELGIETAIVAATTEAEEPASLVTSALSYAPGDAASEVAAAAEAVQAMMDESRLALAAITEEANSATEQILTELGGIGIRPALPAEDAVGGPFLPPVDSSDEASMVDDANAVFAALARFKAARNAIDAAPIHRPIAGAIRMSSNFGNRKDPFTGQRAFHSGADFPAPSGTTVLAAGNGKVSFVGKRSGYGNVVEVTHSGGLLTRYAHLSAALVKEGQAVSTGMPIARVGSTGRSTGPHLHFEVRRDDNALDPIRYLTAGKRLVRFIAG